MMDKRGPFGQAFQKSRNIKYNQILLFDRSSWNEQGTHPQIATDFLDTFRWLGVVCDASRRHPIIRIRILATHNACHAPMRTDTWLTANTHIGYNMHTIAKNK